MRRLGLDRAGLRRIGAADELDLVPGYGALYLCMDGSGHVVADLSGNGRHGTRGATAAVGGDDPAWGPQGLVHDAGDLVAVPAMPSAGPSTRIFVLTLTSKEWIAITDTLFLHATSGPGRLFGAKANYFAPIIPLGTPIMLTITAASNRVDSQRLSINAGTAVNMTIQGDPAATIPIDTFFSARLGTAHAYLWYPFEFTPLQTAQNYEYFRTVEMPKRGAALPLAAGGTVSNVLPEALLFRFDDAWVDTYTTAFPIMEAAGLKGTVYVNSARVGLPNYMTDEHLIELDAAGWDIANHGATHADLLTKTQAQQEAEFSTCADYLDALGLTRASHHVAYPTGPYNADTLAAMAATGMRTGMTTLGGNQTVPIAKPYEMGGMRSLTSDAVSLATATDALVAPVGGRILTYFAHRIVPAPTTWAEWPEADFAALVAYVKARGCRVVTISQLWDYVQAGYTWPAGG